MNVGTKWKKFKQYPGYMVRMYCNNLELRREDSLTKVVSWPAENPKTGLMDNYSMLWKDGKRVKIFHGDFIPLTRQRRAYLRKERIADEKSPKTGGNKNRKKTSCKYRGVYSSTQTDKYITNITVGHTCKYLGSYETQIEGALVFDEECEKHPSVGRRKRRLNRDLFPEVMRAYLKKQEEGTVDE